MISQKNCIEAKEYKLYSPSGEFLTDLNFSLKPGEIIFLKGANGSGKSTFLRCVFDQLSLKSNTDRLKVDLDLKFSFLAQSLNREFFVPMNLGDVAKLKSNASKKTQGLLSKNLLEKSWNVASGGEKQRALLEQSFSQDCPLYLLDEPFNHLDADGIKECSEIIQNKLLNNASVLMATHVIPKELKVSGTFSKTIELKRG